MEDKVKTGAVICKKPIPGKLFSEYEALMFVTGIPNHVTDSQLHDLLKEKITGMDTAECISVIVRSDINATSNEVYEQFNNLNGDAGKGKIIPFSSFAVRNT